MTHLCCRHLTSEPHIAGTKADTQQAQWVAEQWRDQGLDTVNLVPYDVLLSYPDPDQTNTVSRGGRLEIFFGGL